MNKRALMGPILLSLALGAPALCQGDTLHVAADSTVVQDEPNTPHGSSPSVIVRKAVPDVLHGYVRFDLSPLASLPPGTLISRAVLRMWAGTVLDPGTVDVHPVLAPWDESTLTWNSAPSLGAYIARLRVGTEDSSNYVTVDVTGLVQDWLDGTLPNAGLALLPETDDVRLELDSKENPSTSHAMELEVVLRDADSGGDITAVNTPAGSGLQGGAASGGANLSLLTGCGAGQILKWTGSSWACAADATGSSGPAAWSLTGNAGTTATNFLGTTDFRAFELRVNGVRALRVEPILGNPTSTPNLIGGHQGNNVGGGAAASVIAGGGIPGFPNIITASNSVIGGGNDNIVTGMLSVVGGGHGNRADAGAVIGGGTDNVAALGATVGGGDINLATGSGAVIPGGLGNQAGGRLSFAAGAGARVRTAAESGTPYGDHSTFVWADMPSSQGWVDRFTSTGPNQFLVRATGGVGINTNAPATGSALTVGGNTTMTGNLAFGATTRQMINLWSTGYGIGVQSFTAYFRSDGGYAWFQGGSHNDAQNNAGGGQRQMRLDAVGNLFVRGTVSGGGADFAEMLAAQEDVAPGDVLAIGPDGRLTLSTEPYQDSVAGVYSTKPGLLGGAADGEDLTGKIPLAVSGVIPVKVTDENGPIAPGDSLTSSSTPGRAMKAAKVRVGKVAFFPSGVILGKALEPLASGEGVIQVLVVLQ